MSVGGVERGSMKCHCSVGGVERGGMKCQRGV